MSAPRDLRPMIPFSPPRIDEATIAAVTEVLRSGWITTGPRTKEFERRLAAYCKVPRVIALNSWTNAAELVLRWYGVGPGDEVIVPAYTYCASANIVEHVGAKLVLVDVLDDATMDPDALRRAITSRTKCIIPVDIGGLPARMDAVMAIAEEARANFTPNTARAPWQADGPTPQELLGRPLVLGDAAHSFGAHVGEKAVGALADITGFSFHAVKNLTTAEGGALAFNLPEAFDPEVLYALFNTMSLHGQSKDALAKTQPGAWRYDVAFPGWKCNMTDMQAAIGLVELDRYDNDTLPRRRAICARYDAAFAPDMRTRTPVLADGPRKGCHHLYVLRLAHATEEQRDAIIRRIAEAGVSVNVHFQPLPLLSYYAQRFNMADFPVAYRCYKGAISLPVYYDLTDAQVDTVIAAVRSAMDAELEA